MYIVRCVCVYVCVTTAEREAMFSTGTKGGRIHERDWVKEREEMMDFFNF